MTYVENRLAKKFKEYVRSANDRGIPFCIEYEVFKEYIQKPCHYCGLSGIVSGLDRVDNFFGYEKENVVPCCAQCNRAKYTGTKEEFVAWIERAYNHLFKKDSYLEGIAELGSFIDMVDKYQMQILKSAISCCEGNKKKAAKAIGITYRQMRYLCDKYKI